MTKSWTLEATDPASGRAIYARDAEPIGQADTGTYDFKIARDFQVRDAQGAVLLQAYGTAKGEYWCGAFLFFVEGSKGTRVRLEESDAPEDLFYDVPDTPLPPERIRQ